MRNEVPANGVAGTCGDSLEIRQQYPYWAKRPEHQFAHYQRQSRDDHDSACIQGGNKISPLSRSADAFYEWQKLDAKKKQPFAIAMKDGQPYALAGLWEKWKDRKAGDDLLTFTVITADPNEVVQPLHDRYACHHSRTRLRALAYSRPRASSD
jgi:1-acyl-sn-glycerol-3-phosphate acyltransferase